MRHWIQEEVHERQIATKCDEMEAAGAVVFGIYGSIGRQNHAIIVAVVHPPALVSDPAPLEPKKSNVVAPVKPVKKKGKAK